MIKSLSDVSPLVALALGLIGIYLAIYQERIRRRLHGPKLSIHSSTGEPHCLKCTPSCYYFRLGVENEKGRLSGHEVELYASGLSRKNGDGSISTFPTMNLTWAYIGGRSLPLLAPGTRKYCDLGRVDRPSDGSPCVFKLCLEMPPRIIVVGAEGNQRETMGDVLEEPGDYQLIVCLAATDADAQQYAVDIHFSGCWHDDPSNMFSHDGVVISARRVY
jgi:hypothetical protein